MHAKWKAATAMQERCFGWAFILAKKRSMLEMALKNTSEGKSYQTYKENKENLDVFHYVYLDALRRGRG